VAEVCALLSAVWLQLRPADDLKVRTAAAAVYCNATRGRWLHTCCLDLLLARSTALWQLAWLLVLVYGVSSAVGIPALQRCVLLLAGHGHASATLSYRSGVQEAQLSPRDRAMRRVS